MKRFVSIALLLTCIFTTPMQAEEKKTPESKTEITLSYAPIVKKTTPAVVNIFTKKRVAVEVANPLLADPIFRHFFGNQGLPGAMRERVQSSLGSGVVVRSDGLIITNNHVVKGGEEIRVVLHDRRELAAKILFSDDKTDLAVLRLEKTSETLPFLTIADSDTLEIGDLVLAIGNPFGVGQTVTSGIVSALARTGVSATDYQFFIQTDAAINPGNSGGALINMKGELVGINTAILSGGNSGSIGIGFAIPSNMVSTIVKNAEHGGKNARPWLGISTQPLTQELANSLQLKTPQGALITQIHTNGPADKAGIMSGDVITGIENHTIDDEQSLRFRIATYEIGQKVTLDVIRQGKPIKLTLTLSAPPEEPKRDLRTLAGNHPLDGATIANLSPALAEEINLSSTQTGVVIMRIKNGIAARLGLEKGDIIEAINNAPITSTQQLEKILTKKPQGWTLTIKRGDQKIQLRLG